MSKLLNIKKYLSLEEASLYLSSAFEEKVTVADICKFALDRYLTLSVKFNSYIEISPGHEVEESCLPYSANENNTVALGLHRRLFFEDGIMVSEGIWDLSMLGREVMIVDELLSFEEGTPAWRSAALDVVILKKNSVFGKLKGLKSRIETSSNVIDGSDSLASKEVRADCRTLDYYDHELAVRKDEVDRLIRSLSEEKVLNTAPIQEDKPLGTTERNKLLALISALLGELKIDPSERGVVSSIQLITEKAGTPISENTLRKILKQIRESSS